MNTYLEVRRHTKRDKPRIHISQKGVNLARKVSEGMGDFQLVVTSILPRAIETAIAMGYAPDMILPELAYTQELIPEDLSSLELNGKQTDFDEWNYSETFQEFIEAMEKNNRIKQFADWQISIWKSIAEKLPEEGRSLIISHGGIIETPIARLFPDKVKDWGKGFKLCEGALLTYDSVKREFTEVKVLRVKK